MLEYEEKVRQFIKKHQLINKGDKIVVGVSGGPDSLSLLHYLARKRDFYGIDLFAVHLDHMFRGQESYEELLFVEEFCKEFHIPCLSKRINVSEIIRDNGTGLQETARMVRYQVFQQAMTRFAANKLALAHHGDDQVETILMRLTRGTSGKGRAGIPYLRPFHNGWIIRPLLGITKEEILAYCDFYRLNPRIDPSNSKGAYTRNRFRLEVLPFLKTENPKVHEHFQTFSEEMLDDERFLLKLTYERMENIWTHKNDGISLDIEEFQKMPLSLQRRGIHLILNYLYKKKTPFTNVHIRQILQLMQHHHPSGSLDLPEGLKVIRQYQECFFGFIKDETKEYSYELKTEGKVVLPNGDQLILTKRKNADKFPSKDDQFCLNREAVAMPLIIRTRKPGDRIALKGMNGFKKVKKVFIDLKVPRSYRDHWPIVADSKGKVLWIPGLRKSIFEKQNENENDDILIYIKQTSSGGQTKC
ncbi:tRNA lysidine(34) synthetase TilS [Bacillus smithii]|uniref:tRNA lysidine(34) synthetase TilS n=1 Tax=Bacillus smithii TaxID=1479 RepID=UPI00065DF357|nr:tRNA lysidine(34) synthetase TilS [Bacillus smithii]AKP45475.1 tRNA(Ile)-lysidine synthetase [Bacillus smithii]MED4884067.1 tRNA lysidine(34) synthetase TilS [Bacillus smithii]MED4928198.1 tRNA lysidine(34) synthetase TilS [Bacillus smithii]